MPLKPGYTTIATDKDVLIKAGLTDEAPTTNLLGNEWNLQDDTVRAINYYTMKINGVQTKLKDLKPEDIKTPDMTRDLLTRITAQSYDRLGRLCHPVIASLKMILSKTCEVMGNHETKKSIEKKDEELAELSAEFLRNLTKFDNLIPVERAMCPKDHDIWGAIYPGDGGLGGYAASCYVLSEESNRTVTMNDDARTIIDDLGTLEVGKDDMELLDDVNLTEDTFSDHDAAMCEEYEKTFEKIVTYPNVTSEFLRKHGSQNAEETWKMTSKNTLATDKLVSRLLMCKSKTSKRSIPGNEILSKPMSMDLMIANAKVFARRKLLANRKLNLIVNGDSLCTALLMNPNLQSKNILLQGASVNTHSKAKEVLEILPNAEILFTWSPGISNPADLSTKLIFDPITQVNSELFRNGPNFYNSKTEILKNTYMKVTNKGVKWFGLPEEVTKIKQNVEKLKELLKKKKDDALVNEASLKRQETIDADADAGITINLITLDPSEIPEMRCNMCLFDNMEKESCGVYLTSTKSILSKPKAQGNPKGPVIHRRHQHLQISDKVRQLEAKIVEFNFNNANCNLIHDQNSYVYALTNPVIDLGTYLGLLNKHSNWSVTFGLLKNVVNALIGFKRKTIDTDRIKWEAETWRAIILTSQKWFPITATRGFGTVPTIMIQGMRVSNFNLATDSTVRLYGQRHIPLINNKDPMVSKLIRFHHTPSMMVIHGNNRFHRPRNLTMGRVMEGKFGIITNNLARLTSECIGSCPPCLKIKMESYRVPLGLCYTRTDSQRSPFECLSIDPLMPISSPAWPGSRKVVTLYPLLMKCINTGAIDISIMEDNTTRSIILKLLSLEARFGIGIKELSTDAGTNLIMNNLNPSLRADADNRLFRMLEKSHTALPRSQWTNYSESSTRQVKHFLKKALSLTEESALPMLQRDEWMYLMDIIALELNSVPYLKDSEGSTLAPADLLYVSRGIEVRFEEIISHFANIKKMIGALKEYHELLKEEMKNVMRIQYERYQAKQMADGGKIGPQVGDVVMWVPVHNDPQYGVIVSMEGSKGSIRQKDGKMTLQKIANLTPLVVQSWKPDRPTEPETPEPIPANDAALQCNAA